MMPQRRPSGLRSRRCGMLLHPAAAPVWAANKEEVNG
jgi:hypothetical protein